MNPWWSWLLAAVGITGLVLAGRRQAIGWAVGLAAQAAWIAYALATRQWGFIASAAAYGAVYARNWWTWRARFADLAHQEIEELARRDGTMCCPERHDEDIEPWQVPHSARPALRAGLRDARRRTGKAPQALRCWRHRGATCPDTTPTVTDTPLPGLEGGTIP